jgi:hypothetical protein
MDLKNQVNISKDFGKKKPYFTAKIFSSVRQIGAVFPQDLATSVSQYLLLILKTDSPFSHLMSQYLLMFWE